MSSRTRPAGKVGALTLATAGLVASTGALQAHTSRAAADPLAAGSDFTISSRVSTSVSVPDDPALLHPGVTRYLWYTVANPLSQPITVTRLGIERVDAPAQCSAANLDLAASTFSGSLVVPAHGTGSVPVPIALIDLPTNQDACKDVTFAFTYSGTGWYADEEPPVTPSPDPTGTVAPNPGTSTPSSDARVGTVTVASSSQNPVAVGNPVTLTARVSRTANSVAVAGAVEASAQPTGIVSFFAGTPTGTHTLIGAGTIGPDGLVQISTTLPAGTRYFYAVYAGTDTFAGSSSPETEQAVIAPPAQCTATYATSIIGIPGGGPITGTTGNDFIYAVGGDFRIKAGKGSDCIVVGDGTNVVSDGSGADVVIAGNGRNTITLTSGRNVLIVGNGDANRVTVKGTAKKTKKGSKLRSTPANSITIGNGAKNRVTIRKGSRNVVIVGDGAANRVTIRKGSKNAVTIGGGAKNRVTLSSGSKNRVTVGNGSKNRVTLKGSKNRVTIGSGIKNKITARAGSRATVCSVPKPATWYRGKPARYYRDVIVRCRVMTR